MLICQSAGVEPDQIPSGFIRMNYGAQQTAESEKWEPKLNKNNNRRNKKKKKEVEKRQM